MKTRDLIAEASSLPIEEKILLLNSLLQSINPPETEIDREWAKTAKKRLSALRSGVVKSIPGKVVFDKIRKRFSE